jgi:hypothetical protein
VPARSVAQTLCTKTLDVCLEPFDLILQTVAMRPVLCGIDGLPFQGAVFDAQRIDLATKPVMFGLNVFAFSHVSIVAR